MSRRSTIYFSQTLTPRTLAFTAATGFSDSARIQKINVFDRDVLIPQGITNLNMPVFYLMEGATATFCKYNFMNPADTDAAFRIVWGGGVTYDVNGATGNGVNGFGDTKFNPFTHLTVNNTCIGFYNKKSTAANTTARDIGLFISGSNPSFHLTSKDDLTCKSDHYNTAQRLSISGQNRDGVFIANRTANNSHKVYRNGTEIGSNVQVNATALPNNRVLLLAIGIGATGSATQTPANYSNATCAGAFIGNSLTTTQITAISNGLIALKA